MVVDSMVMDLMEVDSMTADLMVAAGSIPIAKQNQRRRQAPAPIELLAMEPILSICCSDLYRTENSGPIEIS